MRLLYVTDLHGIPWKFKRGEELTAELHPDVVINGGDLLPNKGSYHDKERFIAEFLDSHFAELDRLKTPYLLILGNDDYSAFDESFDSVCNLHPFVWNIAQRLVRVQDYEFIGFNWVVDYPFRLKDRCRMDTKDYVFQKQFGTGLLSDRHGWKELTNWEQYATSLPTIEDELRNLIRPTDMHRAVYVIHMPPADVGLDKCSHGAEVGSRSVHDFIAANQPLLSLHGHIHESPEMTGIWKACIGDAVCIQPGQDEHGLTYVLVDTITGDSNRSIVQK